MKHKNVSDLISDVSKKWPDKESIKMAKKNIFGVYKYPSYTFLEFDQRVNQFANKLSALGVKPKDKVLFFVKPNLDFSVITYALFRLGATVVFIDPGMKREYFFNAIKEVKPNVLIGIPKVHVLRRVFKDVFSNITTFITTSKFSGPKTKSIYYGLKKMGKEFESYKAGDDELAAILYTSGGTGAPKGVEYQHRIFINQTKMLQKEFSLTENDIDIPGFPLFSFFTLAMGMSSVIPDMDPSKPSEVEPHKLCKNINQSKATFLAGSPSIWLKIADYCLEQKLTLPSVKYLVMFGAPVSIDLHRKLKKVLPNGTSYTPYGATECLPVTNISGKEILRDLQELVLNGDGTCVGKPLKGVDLKIIKSTDEVLNSLRDAEELKIGEIGEIIVRSLNVTEAYYEKEEETNLAKIKDGQKIWHRMGDVGYLDKEGRLWFCGRKKHVVNVKGYSYYPNQVESIFNTHQKVSKSALILDHKEKLPAIVIERTDNKDTIEPMLLVDLKNLAQTNPKTTNIQKFFVSKKFPVDVRHNIKIDRTLLEKEFNREH